MEHIIDREVRKHCNTLWDYLSISDELKESNVILVCGGHDCSVAVEAAKLYKHGWAKDVVVSGGVERVVYGYSDEVDKEAVILGKVLNMNGVPKEHIFEETNAKNTGENLDFSIKILKENNIPFNRIIMIHKPYATRRAYMLAIKRMPEIDIMIHSDMQTFDEYCKSDVPIDSIIEMVVGEIQRLIYSPLFGWIDPIIIPQDVLNAYDYLCKLGYTKRLMSEEVIQKCIEGTQDNETIGGSSI